MTEIKIKRLSLENFKCHRSLSMDLSGGNASIYGDNATGKTSIYDALTWLLFGKDSMGNGEKNIEIKPLDATGAVRDHQAVTAVEAVLLVGGEETTLRRTYQELWTTKRGCSEPTYDGNTSEYYVDGVPCKKFAFQEKIKSIVSEDRFMMLTSVSYFANDLSWRDRREILFDICGVAEDKQIMETDSRFAPLLEAMGKLSPEDYKAKLLAQKRGLVGARNEIPARVSECQKTIDELCGIDFAGAKAELEVLNARKDAISGELAALANNSAVSSKQVELQQAQLELAKLEADNQQYRRSQEQAAPDIYTLKSNLRWAENRKTGAESRQVSLAEEVQRHQDLIDQCRTVWIAVNGETFTGGNCPTCGQSLPASQLTASKEAFEARKQKHLRQIEQDADSHKKAKADAETAVKENATYIAGLEEDIASLQTQIRSAEQATVTVADRDGYAERKAGIQSWIDKLQEDLHELCQNAHAAGEGLRADLAELNKQIQQIMALTAKEAVLDYTRERIAALRQDAAATAEKLQKIEGDIWLMEEFSRYKTSFVEESVNGHFRLARFRLFREQANGGLEDRCDVQYGGVPYMGLNNGMRINVGIDIINALSRAYGVTVPLFVDNAESVTKLEGSASQIIRLVVSEEDKELRVEYEN